MILPAFPIIFLVHALAAAPQRSSWAYIVSGTLFTAWMIVALFPLQ